MTASATDLLIARVAAVLKKYEPESIQLNAALNRIGSLLVARTKVNIKAQRLIDKGRLINSIKYEIGRKGKNATLDVGSFAVPYAAIHEFGFKGAVQIREHRRLQTHFWGVKQDLPKRVVVRQHGRNVDVRARPYLRPALIKTKGRILDIMTDVLR